MLVCRHHRCRLQFLAHTFSRSLSTAPDLFTPSSPSSTSTPTPAQDSIFTSPESPWEHVFADIDKMPPLIPSTMRNPLRQRTNMKDGNAVGADGSSNPLSRPKGRRQAMTAREISAFDDMFNMIFNAVSEQKPSTPGPLASSETRPSSALLALNQPPSIGRARPNPNGAPLNDLLRTLRRHSSRVRWTSAIDEELDRKKEEIELCDTDQELLEWAMREVFGESQRWEEEARKAFEAVANGAAASTASSGPDASASTSTSTSNEAQEKKAPSIPPLQPPTYPHLLAHLMRTFRTTYFNPALSLSLFTHASRLSIPSYVFGCTAPAYNEFIRAKWEGWGDLAGVCAALEEMRANGIKGDGHTRLVVESVRREVGEARPTASGDDELENINRHARRLWIELGDAEVMRLLTRIEELALKDPPRKPSTSKKGREGGESWKTAVLDPTKGDGWAFDSWSGGKKDRGKKDGGGWESRHTKTKPGHRQSQNIAGADDWLDLGTQEQNMAYH